MIPYRFEEFLEDLVFLVETGEIPMSRIDVAVERILRVKFISGVFEHPFSDPSLLDIVGCKVRCPTSIFVFLFNRLYNQAYQLVARSIDCTIKHTNYFYLR